jgi:hypothetical protein
LSYDDRDELILPYPRYRVAPPEFSGTVAIAPPPRIGTTMAGPPVYAPSHSQLVADVSTFRQELIVVERQGTALELRLAVLEQERRREHEHALALRWMWTVVAVLAMILVRTGHLHLQPLADAINSLIS